MSIITHQGRSYIEKILSAITEVGFDLRAVPSVFMGGGAAVLKHRVTAQDRLCRPIYLTDVMPTLPGMRGLWGADEDAVSYPVFCSARTLIIRNIIGHGKSCAVFLKGRKTSI